MSELGFNIPPTEIIRRPWFKVSSERPEKWRMDHVIPGLIVQLVIHSTTAAPVPRWDGLVCGLAGHSNE